MEEKENSNNDANSVPTNEQISKLNQLLKQLQQEHQQYSGNVNHNNNREQHFTNTLAQIDEVLSLINSNITSDNTMLSNKKPEQLIYDTLKPLTREVTNFYPRELETLEMMKCTIEKVIELYMKMFSLYHLESVLEIVKELLQRENILLTKSFKHGAGAKEAAGVTISEVDKMLTLEENTFSMEEEEKKYKWSRGRLGYTTFHRDCCEVIFRYIHELPVNQYHKMSLQQIKELMNFMLYFEDYVYEERIQQFITESYHSLHSIITSSITTIPSQFIKESSKELFEELQEKMLKLLFYSTNKELKQSILLLGPEFSYNYFTNSETIEKKLHAIKILEKFANHYYYRGVDVMKDDLFAEWLLNKGMWDVLVSKYSEIAIIKSAEYILKLIVNKRSNKILTEEKFKHFLQLIWEAQEETRRCYIKALDPLKLSYSNISLLIDSLKHVQENGDLYIEEFFYLLEQISRYGSDTQRRATIEILLNVIKKHYLGWKSYSLQRKAMDSLKYCFEKLADGIKDTTERGEMYVELINEFIITPNYLTLTISRKLFESEEKKNSYALEKAARILVEKKHIIETIIELMSSQVPYSQELLYFLKAILEKYKSYNCTLTLSLPEEIMLKATSYPEIFTQLITFTSPKDCEPLLEKLIQESYSQETNFESIKELFYKVNYLFVKTIEPEYFRRKEYKVKINPEELYFVKDLQLLLVTCNFTTVQEQCAELIADLYTNFSENYLEKGRKKTIEFMKELLLRIEAITLEEQLEENFTINKQESMAELYGILCLMKELLYATEQHGVSEESLKPQNALVTTSLIKVKIWNNSSYGDDVQKCYEKSVPSNMLLFELLTELSEKFKCAQYQLYLQEGSNLGLPAKYNGRTLLELGFGQFREFSAYKNTKVEIERQPLKLSNNQLNPLFINIIKEIFEKYSVNNKMGEEQIINYIRGVTNSPSHSRDSRVMTLLKEYDLDKDGYLTMEDLLRFYNDSCDGGDREDNVWVNIENLHYRKDLRRFDSQMGPVKKEDLFRYYVKNSNRTYELLFNICNLQEFNKNYTKKLTELANNILGHLPTCENLVSDFEQPLILENKTIFEINYVLVNVRYFLEKESQETIKLEEKSREELDGKKEEKEHQQNQQKIIEESHHHEQHYQQEPHHPSKSSYIEKFIANKNDLTLFNLIVSFNTKPEKSEEEKVLIAVSLNILRLLINFPSLSIDYLRTDKYQIEDLQEIVKNKNLLNLESYQFFLELVENSIEEGNVAVLEPALTLLLNQQNLAWQQWMYNGLFHQEVEIRKLLLNFLVFYCVQYEFPIDFFDLKDIKIDRQRCEEWFFLMLFFVSYRKSVSITVLESVVEGLENEYEEISPEGCYNPILNGNLNLLTVLVRLSPTFVLSRRTKLYNLVKNVMGRTLSNENRLIGYQLMLALNPKATLEYMYNLIKLIKPTEKYQIKENFVGIKNLGSTCYMNSILQQFFTIEKFKQMVLTFPLKEIPTKTVVNEIEIVDDFLYQLQKMYTYLEWSKKKYYMPKEFCLTIKDYNKKPINTSNQEDAHEFLNNLFDKIETYMKPVNLLPELERVFQGKTVCEIACGECESKKSKIEDFYHLALEVKNVNTLEESFKKFILPEIIEDYYCEKCQKKSKQITKQTLLNELPEILIVNLQRIVFDLETFRKVKVHSRLEFPFELSLKEYLHGESECLLKDKFLYKLKGVVIHSGTSEGGHYYSLIKVNNEWYKFNDETVSRFNISELEREAFGGNSDGWGDSEFSTNAYILFYERVVVKGECFGENKEMNEENVEWGLEIKEREEESVVMIEEQQQEQEQQIISNKMSEEQQEQVEIESDSMMEQEQEQQQQIEVEEKPQNYQNQPLFLTEVTHQNKLFYYELQLHQESYFTFITNLYQSIRPKEILELTQSFEQPYYKEWQTIVGLDMCELVMNIFIESIKFVKVYSQLSNKVINDIGMAVYELMTLLPEKACGLIGGGNYDNNNIDDKNKNIDNSIIVPKEWIETICTHSEISIRELYKVVLNKCIFVYVGYKQWKCDSDSNAKENDNIFIDEKMQEQQPNEKCEKHEHEQQQEQKEYPITIAQTNPNNPLKELLLEFLTPTTLETINKNIYKSYFFFEFWWVNIQMHNELESFCLKNNYLEILLDLLMGSEGGGGNSNNSSNGKEKKRQDLPYEMVGPLMQSVVKLLNRKKNTANAIPFKTAENLNKNNNQEQEQQHYYTLTTHEQAILTSPVFYKRMIRLKYDNGLLSQIVSFMCYENEPFSANICELFLIGLNNIDEIENSLSLLNNIKSYLLIDDGLKEERVRWMLGVPQFDHATKMSYGLRHSNESSNIVYVSSRFFIGDEKYRPAMQVLHDKRCYFSDFEVHGIMTLLEILLNNEFALKHVLSMPPPSYLYRDYLSWIEQYSIKLSSEDHYGLTMDKKFLGESLENLLKQLLPKVSTINGIPKGPILPKVIGKNSNLFIEEEIENETYTIKKWVHETFVIDNLPLENSTEKGNLSLPDELFGIKESKSYAQYFIENHDIKEPCDIEIPTEKTVNTLEIDTKKPLKLTFMMPSFDYQIYINKGTMFINYAYTDFPLEAYIEVKIRDEDNGNGGKENGENMIEMKSMSKNDKDNKDNKMEIEDTYGPSTNPNAKKDYEFDTGYGNVADVAGYSCANNDNGFDIPCEVCTYLNYPGRTKCEMCDTPL